MKKSELRQLIREEIQNVVNEMPASKNSNSQLVKQIQNLWKKNTNNRNVYDDYMDNIIVNEILKGEDIRDDLGALDFSKVTNEKQLQDCLLFLKAIEQEGEFDVAHVWNNKTKKLINRAKKGDTNDYRYY